MKYCVKSFGIFCAFFLVNFVFSYNDAKASDVKSVGIGVEELEKLKESAQEEEKKNEYSVLESVEHVLDDGDIQSKIYCETIFHLDSRTSVATHCHLSAVDSKVLQEEEDKQQGVEDHTLLDSVSITLYLPHISARDREDDIDSFRFDMLMNIQSQVWDLVAQGDKASDFYREKSEETFRKLYSSFIGELPNFSKFGEKSNMLYRDRDTITITLPSATQSDSWDKDIKALWKYAIDQGREFLEYSGHDADVVYNLDVRRSSGYLDVYTASIFNDDLEVHKKDDEDFQVSEFENEVSKYSDEELLKLFSDELKSMVRAYAEENHSVTEEYTQRLSFVLDAISQRESIAFSQMLDYVLKDILQATLDSDDDLKEKFQDYLNVIPFILKIFLKK